MVLLSVVVPAYNVEDYIVTCLDSLFDQDFGDFEVIAVDDRSPDRSGELLDAYARRDARLRVLHLAQNRGLGGAREAGLAAASGEYVWFVDADDWVAEGSLGRIASHLRRGQPDVLVIGHAVTRPSGSQRAVHDAVLASIGPTTTAVASPQVLRTFPSAWNKVIRRAFLRELDLPFPRGTYEDIPVVLPLLCAAGSIGILDEICLHYRQRPGSILGSSGERHLEVIDQYELTFERLQRLGPRVNGLEPAVYAFMIQHLFLLLGAGRLDRVAQREHFRRASELARRHRPAGYIAPTGLEGLRDRLLLRGAWRPVVALRGSYQLARRLADAIRPARSTSLLRDVRSGVKRAVIWLAYLVETRRSLDRNLVLYNSLWGRSYSGNPRAIHERALELAPGIRGVWAVRPEAAAALPRDAEHVVIGTYAYYRTLARAAYLISDAGFGNSLVKRPGQVFLQTHHGTTLKTMGVDEPPDPHATAVRRRVATRALLRRCAVWDYNLSSNPYSTEIWRQAYPVEFTTLEYGYPRNDRLLTTTPTQALELRAALGLEPDETVVLYAPTHRGEHQPHAWQLDPDAFAEALPDGHRLLTRAHYFDAADPTTDPARRAVDVTGHALVEELYLVADVLVTDYSSTMFDYALLDRPVVIYAPDWDDYRATRGTYFDLSEHPPGRFTRSYEELVETFRSGQVETGETRAVRAAFRDRFCVFDDGRAAERVVRRLFLDDEPELPVRRGDGQIP